MLYYRIILYYYHWYCTVLSLYCTCGSPNRKESSPNSSSTICCKLEPPPPSSPRPPRSCGWVPSSVQVQLPVSVHRLTCATLCSFSSLLTQVGTLVPVEPLGDAYTGPLFTLWEGLYRRFTNPVGALLAGCAGGTYARRIVSGFDL